MRDSEARSRDSRARRETACPHTARTSSLAIVLVTTKLRHPVLRPGTVGRPRLIDLLAPGKLCPVVSVVAPPGFGKTTLLAQWACGRPKRSPGVG